MPGIHKTYTAKVTAAADPAAAGDAPGTFEAIVSVFGNVDSYGDVVEAGAFAKTLKTWAAKGRPIPVVWSHQMSDPDNILGEYIAAEETTEGLKMKGVMDLDHPRAARIYKLMQKGLIAEFSFSGEVMEYDLLEEEEDSWWVGLSIKEVDLWEAGPCFKGANPDTQLISIKSADLTGPLARRIQAQGEQVAKAAEPPAPEPAAAAPEAAGDEIVTDPPEPLEEPADTVLQRTPAATPNVRALLELFTLE